MRVIIAGSRHLKQLDVIYWAVSAGVEVGISVSELVCGLAPGADSLGEQWAKEHKIPVRCFPAEWGTWGKSAGPCRNQAMADYAEALIAVKILGVPSKGTDDMIRRAKARNLPYVVCTVPKKEAGLDTPGISL